MKIKTYLLLLLTFFALIEKTRSQNQDFTITIKESILNKMVASIGEIKGTNQYSFMFIHGTYDWSLLNPGFQIHPGKLDFVTDVTISQSGYKYTTSVTGNAEVCYEPSNNLIFIEITEAQFPLNIMFLGKLRHLWNINLAPYFSTPFTFEGPLTIGTEFVFSMPDNTTRTLYAHPLNCGVKIDEKQILVSAEVEFINRNETII
jgi:hypothetical protein